MYEAPGIGLAATQVNVHRQILVLDVSEEKDQPMVIVNPKIVSREGSQTYQEGCLSVPGIFADVDRADRIRVEAQDAEGNPLAIEADGLLAVCIQHEMDHLVGKLFVDYLSPLKRELVRKKLEKQRRHAAEPATAAAL
jgi:peptide deformylase